MLRLKEYYKKEIMAKMRERFGYKNELAIPIVKKVVVNVGIGKVKDDAKMRQTIEQTLLAITGQKPAVRLARKAISGFKVRKGDPCGLVVTLTGQRMYDFLEKLTKVVYPRTRDFRGINLSCLDKNGNLNLGFPEQVAFAEIKAEKVDKIHSLQASITSTAKSKEEAEQLFKLLGFVFKK